ncbi:MAG: F0F1 ATP synthase subunit epsilon [Synechococcaceae cyanobacterium]|nr:F0F1 ATP synthase subunit epsilon [Synechococcaceae cyanobacterium]
MELRLLLPFEELLHESVLRISAEGSHGCFTLLPDHVDLLTALVPGILCFETEAGRERYLAVDEGLLVKRGRRVRVAVRDAVAGGDLAGLEGTVERRFRRLDERERRSRRMLAHLESSVLLGLIDLEAAP